jgi:NDP-sugar pyrophosphorylase family protein
MHQLFTNEVNGSPSTTESLHNGAMEINPEFLFRNVDAPLAAAEAAVVARRSNAKPTTGVATPIRQAVIMAGGKGTRLLPYTALLPKPLMPLGDMTILELLLRRMKNAGITDVVLAVNHLGRLLEAFFEHGDQLGINIRYSSESQPLGTAGPLAAMVDGLDDNFIVANGDLLTTLNLKEMMRTHLATRADASIGVYKRDVKMEFGIIEVDEEKRLVAYREKPQTSYLVSMGIYVLRRDAIAPHLRQNAYLDMPNLLQRMKETGANVRCYNEDCVWLDIGRPDDFALAQGMFNDDRDQFLK